MELSSAIPTPDQIKQMQMQTPLQVQPLPTSASLIDSVAAPTLPVISAPSMVGAGSDSTALAVKAPRLHIPRFDMSLVPPLRTAAPQDAGTGIHQTLDNNSALLSHNHDLLTAVPSIPPPSITMPIDGGDRLPSSDSTLPSLPVPHYTPQTPGFLAPKGTLEGDLYERQRLLGDGSGISQIAHKVEAAMPNHPGWGKFLGTLAQGAATVADIGGRIVAPEIEAFTPGTELNHQRLLDQNAQNIDNDFEQNMMPLKQDYLRAQTANENAQPQIKLLQQQINADKLTETQRNHDMQDAQRLRAQGYKRDDAGNIVPLSRDELSTKEQAVEDLKSAQAQVQQAQQQWMAAKTANLPQQMALARQRAQTAAKNAETLAERLGLSKQEFAFNEDKFYHPQPTAGQRSKADLAQSALDRIGEMRGVLQLRSNDIFGPTAGRDQRIRTWLGSQDPDAQTYNSAARYLADHSAALFGSRSAYIMRQLEQLTNPNSNIAALNAALDEAERTSRGFVEAGTIHGPGGSSSFKGTTQGPAPESPSYAVTATGSNGHKIGTNDNGKTWYDVQTRKRVQ